MTAGAALAALVSGLLSAAGLTLESGEACAPGLVELVRDELVAAGFEVHAGAAATPAPPPLARIALSCDVARGVVEVRVDDALTRKRVERAVELAPDPRAESRAAVEVVEVLRASLAEVQYRPPAQVPEDVRTFVAVPPARSAARSAWRGAVSGGVAVAPGGFEVQPVLRASVARRLGPVAVAVDAGATVRAARLTGQGGHAELGLFDAGLALELPFEFAHVSLRPRIGAGVLGVWASGTARRGFVPQLGATATFLPTVGCVLDAGGLQAAPWLLFSAGLTVGVTPAPVEVRFPDGVAARVGVPVVFATLGVGAR